MSSSECSSESSSRAATAPACCDCTSDGMRPSASTIASNRTPESESSNRAATA
eukprot:CAMPEP_0181248430 /NCGR_PEP_ID=MMETSP1096-20121128/45162_1 /TAXON_ID=156174 ORGANISM="Chrysochromulina ericina, Strain CCMP281" /NCGR_SAMPLE_ID=MMETSP1096 /ASSEMBLY_ACC=CAM_ASM_000453 /LENGTH=52 /DNA_ID=CAMNT_0023345591 /DNA_START=627 /DNA_END=782 /DNA_ORIENTATION=+